MMTPEFKQKTVQAILQMLNGLNYADAKEILDAANEKALGALKIILPEAEQPPCAESEADKEERVLDYLKRLETCAEEEATEILKSAATL